MVAAADSAGSTKMKASNVMFGAFFMGNTFIVTYEALISY